MANYVKSTDFAAKDALPKGDPFKKVVGSEIDHEFNSIADSVRTKVDKVLGATPNAVALLNAQGEVIDGGRTLQDLLLEMLPVSTVLPYAGSLIVPDGFLKCEGQAVSRNTYSRLFQHIGTTYGAGNGTTTFNLPNLQGKVLIGSSETQWSVGSSGGSENISLSEGHIPPHEHLMFSSQDSTGTKNTGAVPPNLPAKSPPSLTSGDYVTRSASWSVTEWSQGLPSPRGESGTSYDMFPTSATPNVGRTGKNRTSAAAPFSILQPYLVLHYIIKY